MDRFNDKPEKYSKVAQSSRNLQKKVTSILNDNNIEQTFFFNTIITNLDYSSYLYLLNELEKEEYIKKVELNPFTGTLTLEYLISSSNEEIIRDKIISLGFNISDNFIDSKELNGLKTKILVSLISSMVLYIFYIQNTDNIFTNYSIALFVFIIQFFCSLDLYKKSFYYLKKRIFSFSSVNLLFVSCIYLYSLLEITFPYITISEKTYFVEFSILITILLLERNIFLLLQKDSTEKYNMLINYLEIDKTILNSNISINTNIFKKNNKIMSNYPIFILFSCIISFLFWSIYNRDIGIGDTLLLAISPVTINLPFMITISLCYPLLSHFSIKKLFLFKSSKSLERLSDIDTLIFDKTVIITDKIPMITDIFTFNGFDGNTVLKIAASIENQANNLIAKAIVREAQIRRFYLWTPTTFHQILGIGIESIVNGYQVYIGSKELMKMNNIDTSTMDKIANKLSSEFKTPIFVVIDGKPAGILASQNQVKNEVIDIYDELKKINLNMILVTGDSLKSGISYGESLGLSKKDIFTDCTPTKKLKVIEDLKNKGYKIGILKNDSENDSESEYYKVQNDIVISINKKNFDKNIEDINIYNSNISFLKDVFLHSYEIMKKIKQNIFFSYIYILFNLVFSFGLLINLTNIEPYPVILGIFSIISLIFVYIGSLNKKSTDE